MNYWGDKEEEERQKAEDAACLDPQHTTQEQLEQLSEAQLQWSHHQLHEEEMR